MDTTGYLSETPLLDFSHPTIRQLVSVRGWSTFSAYEKIGAAYGFVKDEIAFGFSEADTIPASAVLRDGYGQCNTKSTLLMALLRKIGVPCRIHGFGIDKSVQRGAVPGFVYALAPQILLHTWVEVELEKRWVHLEGSILDPDYLAGVQAAQGNRCGAFCGYGVATEDIGNPSVQWRGESTYIQKDAIVEDYGVFDTPDELYGHRRANLDDSVVRNWLFKHIIRKWMNARTARIRNCKLALR